MFRVGDPAAGQRKGIDLYTKFLLQAEEGVGGTAFTDRATGKVVNTNGTAAIGSTRRFGTGALSLVGDATTGNLLSVADSTDFQFGTSDFTVDLWAFPSAVPTINEPYCAWAYFTDTSNLARLFMGVDTTNQLNAGFQLVDSGVATINLSGATNPPAGAWYHLAIVRWGSQWMLFLNGLLQATQVSTATYAARGNGLRIGSTDNGTDWCFNGSIDELRISSGIARWRTSFRPPTRSYF